MLGTGDGSGTGGQRGFRRLGGTHKTEKRCAHTAIMPTNRAIDAMAAASSKTTRIIRRPPEERTRNIFLVLFSVNTCFVLRALGGPFRWILDCVDQGPSKGDSEGGDCDHQHAALKNDQEVGAIGVDAECPIPIGNAEDIEKSLVARYFEFFDWEVLADVVSRTFPHGSVFVTEPGPELFICF
jgi:hypothetical protein